MTSMVPAPVGPRVRHGAPGLRVFVFGVEVTEDVSSVVINGGDTNQAPNTMEVVLSNKDDRYVVTQRDISILTELNKDPEVRDAALSAVLDETKRAVLTRKTDPRFRLHDVLAPKLSAAFKGTESDLPSMRGDALRYPFVVGDSIFHTNDAFRVFVRDPESLVWYWGFTGQITDWVDAVDTNNKRLLTLRCEDALRILRYSRFTSNPAIFDQKALKIQQDEITRSFRVEGPVQGRSVVGALLYFLFGDKKHKIPGVQSFSDYRVGVHGVSPYAKQNTGIGAFDEEQSRVFLLGDESPAADVEMSFEGKDYEHITSVADYQAVVDHQVLLSDLVEQYADSDTAKLNAFVGRVLAKSNHEEQIEEVITIIGSHPELFPVDHGRFFALMPATLGKDISTNVLSKEIVTNIAQKTMFKNRLSIIYDLASRLNFSFYATPKGDLAFEMPLYDYHPGDFNRSVKRKTKLQDPKKALYSRLEKLDSRLRFDRYVFSFEDAISWSRAFNDERIRTQVRGSWQLITGWNLGKSDDIWAEPAVITLSALIPQFGPRDPLEIEPQNYVANETAAAICAFIQLNKTNADAKQLTMSFHFRFGLGPNRPCYLEPRDEIATLRSSVYAITWGISGSVSMTLTFNSTRGYSGLTAKNGAKFYEPLSGFASQPFNYRELTRKRGAAAASAPRTITIPEPLSVVAAPPAVSLERYTVMPPLLDGPPAPPTAPPASTSTRTEQPTAPTAQAQAEAATTSASVKAKKLGTDLVDIARADADVRLNVYSSVRESSTAHKAGRAVDLVPAAHTSNDDYRDQLVRAARAIAARRGEVGDNTKVFLEGPVFDTLDATTRADLKQRGVLIIKNDHNKLGHLHVQHGTSRPVKKK